MELTIATTPRSLGRQLIFATSAAKAVCNQLLEPHGLTLAQWAILSSIWRNGEMSVKDLAEMTGNAPPAASRIVDRMVLAGLLVRMPDVRDRRAVVVGTTAKGEGMRATQTIYETVNRILLSDLSSEEQDCLFDLLRRVEMSGRGWLAGSKEAR